MGEGEGEGEGGIPPPARSPKLPLLRHSPPLGPATVESADHAEKHTLELERVTLRLTRMVAAQEEHPWASTS